MNGKKIAVLCIGVLVFGISYSIAGENKETACSGIVTDAQGDPVADVKIEIRQHNPFTKKVETYYVQTDEQGRYEYSNIEWPYTVGVTWSQKTSVAGVYKLQYVRRNKLFDSSKKLNFNLRAFPTGSASISGRVAVQYGEPFQDFTVRIHRKVDWDDNAAAYIIDYGYLLPFSSKDGKFDIKDLPAGIYKVTVFHPNKWDRYEFPALQEVVLKNDQTTNVTCEVFEKPAYYGRVLFEDGKPAYIDSPPWPGARTYVKLPSSQLGDIPAVIDKEGYFTAHLTDAELEQLKNRDFKMVIYYPSYESKGLFVELGTFPVELLSKEKSKAGVVKREKATTNFIIPGYSFKRLSNKPLPELYEFGIVPSAIDANDKAILVCFFDTSQQPSQNCLMQLTSRTEDLKANDITVIAIQVSRVEQAELDEWMKENGIYFTVGMNWDSVAEIRFKWGVKSLPWLILTDKKHVVVAEGFSIDDLDEKITKSGKK